MRTSATVVGAAAGLMVMGYTGQTTDGFVHTDFTGPLGLFGPGSAETVENDIIAIGNGPGDAAALASLLKITAPTARPGNIFEAGSTTAPTQGPASVPTATAGPVALQAGQAGSTPVIDAQGQVDCAGAVSCLLDPRTNTTTVVYSDGTMAIVQRINNMTLVTYQNVSEKAQTAPKMQLPPLTPPSPPVSASPAKPGPSPLASVTVPTEPTTSTDSTAIDSGPAANPGPAVNAGPAVNSDQAISPGPAASVAPPSTVPDITASTARPRVTVTQTPQDYTPSRPTAPSAQGSSSGISGALGAVRDAVKSAVEAVGKAVGSAASTDSRHSTKSPD